VNVLIYAHREDAPEHDRHAAWLRSLTASDEPFALSDHGGPGHRARLRTDHDRRRLRPLCRPAVAASAGGVAITLSVQQDGLAQRARAVVVPGVDVLPGPHTIVRLAPYAGFRS
jgi:hypothetical protein